MTSATAVHEAGHCVAAAQFAVPIVHATVRGQEFYGGRTTFKPDAETLTDFDAAVIKVAGEVAERMNAGETSARFNWLDDGQDAEDARHFVARIDGDELDNRHWVCFRAYALLRARWNEVEAVAAKLETSITLVGAEVMDIIARTKREEEQDRDRLLGFRPVRQKVALAKLATRGRTAVGGQATRTFGGLKAQALRSARSAHGADSFTIRGYASVYNQLSHDLGGFRERISPGAFDAVLATDPDVHFVWDHDTRYVLARTRSGTLHLNSDAVGLHVNADVGPYSYAKDLRVALERGDIDQASFSFTVGDDGDEWAIDNGDNVRRTIRTVSGLYDVTVTAKGAYPQTTMGVV